MLLKKIIALASKEKKTKKLEDAIQTKSDRIHVSAKDKEGGEGGDDAAAGDGSKDDDDDANSDSDDSASSSSEDYGDSDVSAECV